MENNYDEQFIIMQTVIEASKENIKSNKKDSDDTMTKFTEESKAMLAEITYHINSLKSSPTQKYSPNPPDPSNVVPTYRRSPPLDGGHSTKVGGMWTQKHEISSPNSMNSSSRHNSK